MAYSEIPKDNNSSTSFRDFRANINIRDSKEADALADIGIIGAPMYGDGKSFKGQDYYDKNNLETKFGFGALGAVAADRLDRDKFLVAGSDMKGASRFALHAFKSISGSFRGDKVTAIDIGTAPAITDIYPEGGKDLINFFFEDGTQGTNVIPFRCTMTGFTDSFSPGWDSITIMGRPDGAYIYKSFERTISFSFTVAALSRSEMIPMWRKLNYLASYTMPDYGGGSIPGGPYMRITIGDLFHRTPGFITALSYTVNDDATWDIAEDAGVNAPDAKQLPQSMEVQVGFTIIGDYRPQLKGRVYSLSSLGSATGTGNWLTDAAT